VLSPDPTGSLEELKAIGEEVGIDGPRLEDAARSVALDGIHASNPFLGDPTQLRYELVGAASSAGRASAKDSTGLQRTVDELALLAAGAGETPQA